MAVWEAEGMPVNRADDLRTLVRMLIEERFGKDASELERVTAIDSEDELFQMYRNLVNTREPIPAPDGFLPIQDRVLQSIIEDAGITNAAALPRVPLDARLSLWRGDITTLAIDAIVNAANSRMLGCWVPGHYCIDNAIHSFAGVQLRLECARLMRRQGYEEPTGRAKVTPAYNLPAQYVIHTVGPVANGHPSARDRELLAQSYASCLDAAIAIGCKSIAFCCISTGVFGFPQEEAAEIAVRTVRKWLDAHEPNLHVVFNVFGPKDEEIYRELLYNARFVGS